jgi:ribonuclease P protein component
MRLTRARQFAAVFAARVRVAVGPLSVWGIPNDAGHPRLGLAISRRVGSAVVRNRIRRRLREAFRLRQHDLLSGDRGYDLVIGARRHEPMTLAAYEQALRQAARALEQKWATKRNQSSSNPSGSASPPGR